MVSFPYVIVASLVTGLGVVSVALVRRRLRLPVLVDVALAVIMVLFVGLRADSIDYGEYVKMYDAVQDASAEPFFARIAVGKDGLFGLLMVLVADAGLGVVWIFFFTALLSMVAKIVAFRSAFGSFLLAFAVYFYTYFFLHDFTAIRAGVSIAMCFCGLVFAARGMGLAYLLSAILAVGFHSQAALFVAVSLPLLLGFDRGLKWMALIAAALVALAPILMNIVIAYADRPGVGVGDEAASSNLLAAGTVNAILLSVVYWAVRSRLRTELDRRLMSGSMVLVFTGLLFLFGAYRVSMALGARASEMFMCFGVFVIVSAIRAKGSVVAWFGCAAYVFFNAVLLVRGPLLVDYHVVGGGL